MAVVLENWGWSRRTADTGCHGGARLLGLEVGALHRMWVGLSRDACEGRLGVHWS